MEIIFTDIHNPDGEITWDTRTTFSYTMSQHKLAGGGGIYQCANGGAAGGAGGNGLVVVRY